MLPRRKIGRFGLQTEPTLEGSKPTVTSEREKPNSGPIRHHSSIMARTKSTVRFYQSQKRHAVRRQQQEAANKILKVDQKVNHSGLTFKIPPPPGTVEVPMSRLSEILYARKQMEVNAKTKEVESVALTKPMAACLKGFKKSLDYCASKNLFPQVDVFALAKYQDHNKVKREEFKQLFESKSSVYFDVPNVGWGIGEVLGFASPLGADGGTLALIIKPILFDRFPMSCSFYHDPSYECFVVNVYSIDCLGYCYCVNVLPVSFKSQVQQ